MFFIRSLLAASAIGGALAQINGVSTQCQNTIIAVAASSRAECLNPTGLLQVFLQGTSGSIVSPVDSWLKGLCALAPCSNDDLASIVTNVTTGCATEFQSIAGDAQPGALTPLVQQIYPTVRKAVCLADASKNNQLCVTQTLSLIETATGTLSIDKITKIVPAIAAGDTSSINGINLCTPCVKQIYNVAKTDFPAIFDQSDIASDVKAKCGDSFVDGASDSNILQTAGDKTASGSSTSGTGSSAHISGQQALLSTFLFGLLALAA